MAHYQKPPAVMSRFGNPVMMALVRKFGINKSGIYVLTVTGRRSGKPRSVPVNPMDFEGSLYLISPRGDTEWARNLRATRSATLERGGESEKISVTEVDDGEKPTLIKEYLRRWAIVSKAYFGVGADPTLEQVKGIASKHPVFRISK